MAGPRRQPGGEVYGFAGRRCDRAFLWLRNPAATGRSVTTALGLSSRAERGETLGPEPVCGVPPGLPASIGATDQVTLDLALSRSSS